MMMMMMMTMMMIQVQSVYVEDPSRTRIMQWTDVANPDGTSSSMLFHWRRGSGGE